MVKRRVDGQRMLVVSLDAVGSRDLEYMRSLPNFKRIWDRSAYCDHVKSVYPSITYPAHSSIVTGMKPGRHGVVNNIRLQPKRSGKEDWLWQRKYINVTTIYDQARKNGWTTAALLWPVTAQSKIKYCVPEIFPNRTWQNQVMISALNGPISYQIELLKKFGHLLDGVKQPNLDNFVTDGGVLLYSTCTVLKRENEDVVRSFLAGHEYFSTEAFTLPGPIGEVNEGMITLWPHMHGTDGFFICKMRKGE